MILSTETWVELVKIRVEILKMKADESVWSTNTPLAVKEQLDETLKDVNAKLEAHKEAAKRQIHLDTTRRVGGS